MANKFISKLADKFGLATKEHLSAKEEEIRTKEKLLEDVTEKYITNVDASVIAQTPKKLDTTADSKKVKKTPQQFLNLYLLNQFIFRGVNIRADELISRGYKVVEGSSVGRNKCKDLIERSGGINLFWQYSVNTDIAGDGFLEICPNKKKTDIVILKHIHPVTFGFRTDGFGNIILNEEREPVGYEQRVNNPESGEKQTIEVDKERIAHLRFNTVGDEFTGVSTLQSGYDTMVRLMNMEASAAGASVKTANPLLVGESETSSQHELAKWGKILGRISGKDQVFLPKGMKLRMMSPGTQNFSAYSDYFINAVVAALGVPKYLILGIGEGSNRAVSVVQSRHFYSLIRSNQRYMEDLFNKIFEFYGKLAGFKPPKLQFEDVADDVSETTNHAKELFEVGIIDRNEAREMIGLYPTKANKVVKPVEKSVDASDMETWHEGPANSPQKGEKKKQIASPFSETKKNG